MVAIPLTIRGEDAEGKSFTEVTHTVVVTRDGGKLLTSRELFEGATLKITLLSTNRTATARVVWLGKKSGPRREIGIVLETAEDLWGIQFPEDAAQGKPTLTASEARSQAEPVLDPPAPKKPMLAEAPTPAAPAPAVISKVPAGHSAPSEQLADTLNQLVETALEANLRPVVERLSNEALQQIIRAQLANSHEQFESAITACSDRLEMRAIDIVTRNEQALQQISQQFIEAAEQKMQRRQEDLVEKTAEATRNQMLELALSNKAQLHQEAADLVWETRAELRQSVQQDLTQIEKRFDEQCRARAERFLLAHLEEVGETLAKRVGQAEEEIAKRLERRADEIGGCFAAQLQKHLEEATGRIRESFMRHLVTELNQKQQECIQQAARATEEAAEQNLRRTREELIRLMKHLGEAMINPEGSKG